MPRPENKSTVPLGRQVAQLVMGLERIDAQPDDPRLPNIITWVKDLPIHVRSEELYARIAKAFKLEVEDLKRQTNPKVIVEDFETLLPRHGFLRDYVEYTRSTEPPTVFHFFVGATILGATLRRHVHLPRGDKNIYPNLCIILVAPSGKCRKTTACELGVSIFRDGGGEVFADKVTPESLVDVDPDHTSVTGLIYSGELKQFLGSQKYMEGMIPLLTRLFDCPDIWQVKTIGRGTITLNNIAMSMLAASTMDWMKMLPGDTFGGGFMSRFLLIVQEDSPRRFPLPERLPDSLRIRLLNRLRDLTLLRAKFSMTPNTRAWYVDWYNALMDGRNAEKMFSGYYERKPTHLLRLAMLLSISEDDSTVLEMKHMSHAVKILDWVEKLLPAAFDELNSTAIGEDQQRMLSQLRRKGGTINKSDWMRMNGGRMDSRRFNEYVNTLRISKLVDFDQTSGSYYLTTEGWRQ